MAVGRLVGRAALVCLVVGALMSVGVIAPSSPARTDAPPVVAFAGPCSHATAPEAPSGVVTVEGGPLPATAASGVTVDYSYSYELRLVNNATGAVLAVNCDRRTVTATTDPTGAFELLAQIPSNDCGSVPRFCTYTTGPFGPFSVGLSAPPPVGYASSVSGGPSTFAISEVYELAEVRVSPEGPTLTVAPGAPTTFTAEGFMANGSETPLEATFSWSLNGSGWSFPSAPSGPTATVLAVPGAGVGALEVAATAGVPGATLAPPPVHLTLLQQSTAIEEAELDRTTVDANSTIVAHLVAVGAAGYPYSATVAPGLGLRPVAASCVSDPSGAGTTNVSCSANLTYPFPGIAQPTARLTNGYSSTTWQYPDVTIDPPPVLSAEPGAPVGYAASPLPIELVAATGSGAPPYSRACLELATQRTSCEIAPGPTWRFLPTFPAPGDYVALGWAFDSEGANASTSFTVTVVPPLAVGSIGVDPGNVTAGTAVALTATISGGDLPLRYWWNASDLGGSIVAGTSYEDGVISVDLVAPAPAAVSVSLTVIDALGTFAEADRLLSVGPEAAITLAVIDPPPATTVVAGSPFDVAWEAIDRSGAPVRGFGSTAEILLSLSGTPAAGHVNASGLGPLPSLGNGSYGVPTTGWVGGVLNLSVTVTTAGVLTVALTGPGLPGPASSLAVAIAPDRAHLRLLDPVVAVRGSRTNSTFWHVMDRFGNPATGALVTVRLDWGPASETALVATVPGANGTTGAWVNFSAPGPGGGQLTVLDSSGEALLGPLEIPPAAAPSSVSAATVTLAAAVPLGAIGAAWAGLVRRRSRLRSHPPGDEAELRRLAEGRAQAVEIVRRAGTADLAEIEAAWRPPPAPTDLPEWIASLVTDGTFGATLGNDGHARFCLAAGPRPDPQVTVDPEELDRALHRRDEVLGDEGPGP
ncbi:MAG: hypothetical protein ACLQD8_06250 [Thermoplasmata archaeon]